MTTGGAPRREGPIALSALFAEALQHLQPAPGTAPASLMLGNAPNPFHRMTTISFDLATGGDALLEIFDMLGRIVTRYTRPGLPAGRHSVVWNATDLQAGVYRCVMTTSAGSSIISIIAH